MSKSRQFTVNTQGKPRLFIGGRDLRNRQVLSFSEEVVEKNEWIQIAIEKGQLEEVGKPKKAAPSKPAPKARKSAKKAEPKVEEPKVEEKKEEVVEEKKEEEKPSFSFDVTNSEEPKSEDKGE